MSKTCNICLENVSRPAKLNLHCECKYYVHYSCYNKWWKINNNCIICHEICSKPFRYKDRNKTPPRKRELVRRINGRRRRIYPPDTRYIQDYTNRLPFDNENECKTIFASFVCAFIGYFIIRFIFYSNFYN